MYCIIHKDTKLVCPTCLAVARGSKGGSARTEKQVKAFGKLAVARAYPGVYTQRDCLATFQKEPDRVFSREDLVALAPRDKRASAEDPLILSNRLTLLRRRGVIRQVTLGHWMLTAKKVKGKSKKM